MFSFILLTGENSHLLLSYLVKHLDHKNVAKQPLVQICIVNVITQLGQNAKQEATVTIIGAIYDLIKHLRKCLQNSAELSTSPGDCINKQNADLQFAIENCISQLSNKVCGCSFCLLFEVQLKYMALPTIEFDEYCMIYKSALYYGLGLPSSLQFLKLINYANSFLFFIMLVIRNLPFK